MIRSRAGAGLDQLGHDVGVQHDHSPRSTARPAPGFVECPARLRRSRRTASRWRSPVRAAAASRSAQRPATASPLPPWNGRARRPGPEDVPSLNRVVAAAPGKPQRLGTAENQRLVKRITSSPGTWDREQAQAMAARFDELAPTWDSDRGRYRRAPLADAIARGGPWPAGRCVEIGSGTGLLTPLLTAVWPAVMCVDLSRNGRDLTSLGWELRELSCRFERR